MPEVEKLGVNNLGENFERLGDSRAGPIEVLVPVGEENLPISHNR